MVSRSCGRSTRSATPSPPGSDGPDLMAQACAQAARRGHRLYLYGGRNQGALVQLALNLRQRYPGVKIVGGYSPPHRPLTTEEQDAVLRRSTAPGRMSADRTGVPSRRSGWRSIAGSTLRRSSASAQRRLPRWADRRRRIGYSRQVLNGPPVCPRATSVVAVLPSVQPALRHRVRATVAQHRRLDAQ